MYLLKEEGYVIPLLYVENDHVFNHLAQPMSIYSDQPPQNH